MKNKLILLLVLGLVNTNKPSDKYAIAGFINLNTFLLGSSLILDAKNKYEIANKIENDPYDNYGLMQESFANNTMQDTLMSLKLVDIAGNSLKIKKFANLANILIKKQAKQDLIAGSAVIAISSILTLAYLSDDINNNVNKLYRHFKFDDKIKNIYSFLSSKIS